MKKFLLLLLFLSSCGPHAADIVQEKKTGYVGRSIDELMMRFGAPSASGEVAGEQFFTWTNSTNFIYSTPSYNTGYTSGSFSSLSGGYGSYSGTTSYTSRSTNSMQLNCTFTARAKNGLITDMDAYGNHGACERYSNLL